MILFTRAYWSAVGLGLLRTALAGLVPFGPGLIANFAATWPVALSTVALLLIVTIATSLRGIPDTDGALWWEVLLARGLRQFGQYVAAAVVGAVVLSDVDWHAILTGAATSAFTTVILAALTILPASAAAVYVPELAAADDPAEASSPVVNIYNQTNDAPAVEDTLDGGTELDGETDPA